MAQAKAVAPHLLKLAHNLLLGLLDIAATCLEILEIFFDAWAAIDIAKDQTPEKISARRPRSKVFLRDIKELVDLREKMPQIGMIPLPRPAIRRMYFRRIEVDHRRSWFVLKGDERVGFVSILPLTHNAYQSYLAGTLSEWDFTERDFARGPNQGNYLYIQFFGIVRRRDISARTDLYDTVVFALAQFPSTQKPTIISDEGSRVGRTIMNRYGFYVRGQSTEGDDIYEIDLSHCKTLPIETRKMVALYWRYRRSIPAGM